METQGDRIRRLRKELGFTQEQLAKACGYSSREAINVVENGYREMSLSKLRKCAAALGTTSEYLLGKTEIRKRPSSQDTIDEQFEKIREKTFSTILGENSKELYERFNDLSPENRELLLRVEKYLQNADSLQIELLKTILEIGESDKKYQELTLSKINKLKDKI